MLCLMSLLVYYNIRSPVFCDFKTNFVSLLRQVAVNSNEWRHLQVHLEQTYDFDEDITMESLQRCMEELRKAKLDYAGPPPSNELPKRPFGLFKEPAFEQKVTLNLHLIQIQSWLSIWYLIKLYAKKQILVDCIIFFFTSILITDAVDKIIS